MADYSTPLLDELEEGDWPSFVTELKLAAENSPMAADLLRQVERSYADNTGHWKRGGIVGVRGYGGGVVGRYSSLPEEYPGVKEFHTLRVNEPAGFYYTTEKLRELCDVWDQYGSGLLNLHGSTGDIILLGTTTENLQPCFDALGEIGFDLGGSGSAMRTLSCCVGPSRCEHACLDTMDVIHDLTMHFQMEIHRPAWPYKFKIKVSGCPNDCAAASARSDLAGLDVSELDDADLQGLDVTVSPIAGIDEPGKGMVAGSAGYLVAGDDDASIAGAWDFLRFFNSTDNQVRWTLEGSYLPVTESAQQHPDLVDSFENDRAGQWLSVAYEQLRTLDADFPGPVMGPYKEFRSGMQAVMERVAEAGADPGTAIEEFDAEFQSALDAYAREVGG